MTVWKPREEYKTLAERHGVILTRTKDIGPMLVIWTGAHFHPVPGVPVFYGDHQCGWWKHDTFDEWTEIPE